MTVTPALHVYSFGWGHQDPSVPHADIACDVRDWFRNPDIDPKLRDLDGRHPDVIEEVLETPGVKSYINGLFVLVMPLIRAQLRTVTITVGCAGGRHRAPVIASKLAGDVAQLLVTTTATTHMHIDKPLLRPGAGHVAEIQRVVTEAVNRTAAKMEDTARILADRVPDSCPTSRPDQ